MPADTGRPLALGRSHPLVARIRRLVASPEERARDGLIVVEGIHLGEEAIAGGARVREAVFSSRLLRDARGRRLHERLRAGLPRVYEAGDALLASIHQAESHQGVLLLVERPDFTAEDLTPSGAGQAMIVLACGIQDPGNIGSLVRLVDASGGSGLLAAGGADPFGPKAVRASAGSIFRVPVARDPDVDAAAPHAVRMRQRGLTIAGAVPRGGVDYREADLSGPAALILGGEGAGLPAAVLDALDLRVSIPMRPPVESVNVASAAAVLLFEAAARRRLTTPRGPSRRASARHDPRRRPPGPGED